ncbi:Transposase IS200 like protein [Polystyrenella longa]|uniref:Transposase IS200 like protein n=2 Tax=Polystyrenella longa TaxID=2528007 RepID=A0A518CJ73_9PLAN|nr:Transposase IS200 like protein [Polystyrenella longa]
MLAQSITNATKRHCFQLIAFVFMPEHVHLLVHPDGIEASIPNLLKAIKRPFSYRIKQILIKNQSPLLEKLTVLQRPGVKSFRFWLEGPGYDRNITEKDTLEKVIDYIHKNPVKRDLCSRAVDWKWSSARYYLDPTAPADLDLPELSRLPAGWSTQRGT